MSVHLVRHGRPRIVPGEPPHAWQLDPAAYDDVWALRARLPRTAAWFSSPEPKAVATAQLLTDTAVGVVDDLREHVRDTGDWLDDFPDVVRRAVARPDEPAHPGWEPVAACRERVTGAVRRILDTHRDTHVVLVGHGTAWTLVAAELTGREPDLDRWARLGMPDVIELPADLP